LANLTLHTFNLLIALLILVNQTKIEEGLIPQ